MIRLTNLFRRQIIETGLEFLAFGTNLINQNEELSAFMTPDAQANKVNDLHKNDEKVSVSQIKVHKRDKKITCASCHSSSQRTKRVREFSHQRLTRKVKQIIMDRKKNYKRWICNVSRQNPKCF